MRKPTVSLSNLQKAHRIRLREQTPLIYAANTLQTMGQEEAATAQLSAVRALIDKHRPSDATTNESFAGAESFFDFEDAHLVWLRGGGLEAALSKFDAALNRHKLIREDPRARSLYEAIQIRRAFYAYSLQITSADLAAAKILYAKRGPKKKTGGHNVVRGTGERTGCTCRPSGDEHAGESR